MIADERPRAVVQRKTNGAAPDRRPPELYLTINEGELWGSVGHHLRRVQLPQPHVRLGWHDEDRFVRDRGDLPSGARPAVGTILARQFEKAIAGSLRRLGPRWVERADHEGEQPGLHDETHSRVTMESPRPNSAGQIET